MPLRRRGEHGSPWPYHAVIAGQPVMLARLKDGPSWTETKIKYFDQASLISSTDRSYQMFPPEYEFPQAQEDWSGGAGHADQREGEKDTYWYADGVDCSGGWPVCGPAVNNASASVSGSVAQFIEFNSKLYAIADDRIYVRPDDVSVWTNLTPGTDFSANVSGRCVVYQGTQSAAFLFIPIGSGANYYVMSTSEAFTQHASQKATNFEVVGNELWLSNLESNQYVVRKAEDGGTAATWGSATVVGDGNAAITDLRCVQDRLIVMKTDGVYGVSVDAFTVDEQLTPELKGLKESTAGKYSAVWNGSVVFRIQKNLYRYDPSSGEIAQIGPELIERNTSSVKGYVSAIDGQAGLALWATIYNATSGHSYLAKYGSWKTTAKGLVYRPVWHYSLHTFTSKQVTSLFVSTGVYLGTPQPRLYVGCSDGTIYYMVLSTTANVLDDAAYRFSTTSGTLYQTRYTALFPFESKLIKAVGVGGRQLSGSSQQLTAEYKYPADSSYTSIGSVQTDPGERVNLSSGVASQAVDFALILTTTSVTTTPILTHFVIYAAFRTTSLKQVDATIIAGDGVMDRNGKPLRYSWQEIKSNIESAMLTNGSFTAVAPSGDEITVIGVDFSHGYNPVNEDEKAGQTWIETIRMIQTQTALSRGTWARAGAFTWGSLNSFRWSDVAII